MSGPNGAAVAVAGTVAAFREGLATLLQARCSEAAEVGDARVVVLCADGDSLSELVSLRNSGDRRVVIVGVSPDRVLPYLAAGAFSVLPPEASAEEVRVAVEEALRGEQRLPPRIAALVLDAIRAQHDAPRIAPLRRLTMRELEVAQLIAQGCANKEIAHSLTITVSTVKKHVNRVLKKLDADRRREIAIRLQEERF